MKSVKRREKVVAPKSLWPADLQRIFLSLGEIPWTSLTALSTLMGGTLLFVYFRSIGVQLTGLSELVGLGIATALVSLAILVCSAIILFSPALIYQQALVGVDPSYRSVKRKKISLALAGLQFGALGCFMLNHAHTQSVCNGSYGWWLSVGILLCLWGLYSLKQVVCITADPAKRVWSTLYSLLVAGFGVFPIIVLLPLQQALTDIGWIAAAVFLGLFVLIIFLNAVLAPAILDRSVTTFALFVAIYLLLVLPMLGANPVFFPTLVARAVGVRGAEPQELRISNKACRALIAQSSLSLTPNLQCTEGDWSSVSALVLSNVGDRWLVQISSRKVPSATGNIEQLEVTIPREDIQISIRHRPHVSSNMGENACKG